MIPCYSRFCGTLVEPRGENQRATGKGSAGMEAGDEADKTIC